jgi:tetratricopeptide (TPR) repeat protein
LHWIDSETQALLDRLIESLPTAHLLLLVNYRPEYQHSWGSKTYYTHVRLDPLPAASAEAFLAGLLGDDPSLAPLLPLLIARTAGNPFFLEESVRTLVETAALVGTPGVYRLAAPLQGLPVPTTVQAVLAARIDRLSAEDKRLLQTAAVVGTEVPLALLQAIADVTEEGLHHGLARLQAAEFLYEVTLFPDRAYTFKHALTHEVAYGSLLQERRRGLHARLVESLEVLSSDRLAEQVDRLAHHAARGEVWDKALLYCRQAGARAAARSAYRETVGYFEQALVALQHLPDRRETQEQAIDLRNALYTHLFVLGEHRQCLVHLREAETLATALGDQHRLAPIPVLMANTLLGMGDYAGALTSAQRALALATALGEPLLLAQAQMRQGHIYYTLGDYQRGLDLLRKAVEALPGKPLHDHISGAVGIAHRAPVLWRTFLVWALAEVGEFAEGVSRSEEGIRIAEASEDLSYLIMACMGMGCLYLRQGDVHQAIAVLERGLRLCDIGQISTLFIGTAASLGYAYALSGRVAEALPLLERALEEADRTGFLYEQALRVTWLSEAYLLASRREEASAGAARALALARTQQERGHEAWALRLLGEIHAHRHPPETALAEASYREALALAEVLGMRPLQAHCHLGLGTLYGQTGQPAPARTELSAAIALYCTLDMSFWLPQTEAALAQVEQK